MSIVSHPANKNYRDNFDVVFGKKEEKKSSFEDYPVDRPPRYNGGQRCDMWIGPCACGAWHHGADDVLERSAL